MAVVKIMVIYYSMPDLANFLKVQSVKWKPKSAVLLQFTRHAVHMKLNFDN